MIDGKKVKELREAKGHSLRALSALLTDQAGKTVSAEALANVEAGRFDLSIEKTAALASILGVGLTEILLPFEPANATEPGKVA